jgi:hypothetical protein
MRNGIIETAEDMQKIKQIENLQKKLDIATNALKEIENNAIRKDIKTITVLCVNNWLSAHKALKEIDLVGTSGKEEV